VQNIVTGG